MGSVVHIRGKCGVHEMGKECFNYRPKLGHNPPPGREFRTKRKKLRFGLEKLGRERKYVESIKILRIRPATYSNIIQYTEQK